MAITDWPTQERPREKLLQRGPNALSDAELLAIFLRTGVSGLTAVDLARQLLDSFGSLRALLQATEKDFCRAHGLGQAKYVQLQAVLEMARRHFQESLQAESAFNNPDITRKFVAARLADRQQEVFACLFLDNQHRLVRFEELFFGTISSADVYPREVVKRGLALNAAALILAHNHPSGHAQPSPADVSITKRLSQALELVDIRVLDHIVVGHGETQSMAELGLLQAT